MTEATKEAVAEAPARKVSKKELEARISGLCKSRGWNLEQVGETQKETKEREAKEREKVKV